MMNFFQTKRIQLTITAAFAAVSLGAILLTRVIEALSVIEFAYLTLSFGFALAFYFRRAFSFDNIVGWLVNGSALGLLLIPLTFLTLGWLKVNFVFAWSIPFLFICSIAGILSLFFVDQEEIKPYWHFEGMQKIDYLILFIFAIFTGVLTLINFEDFFISWDTFNFWGLDARHIFENHQLRDAEFHRNVLIHRYTSFYPLYYAIIYDLYHGVFEQFASWINVFINLIGMLLVYARVLKKSTTHKLIVAGIILIVGYAATNIVYMFSMYADVLCAFLLLVYFLILTDDEAIDVKSYWQRVMLLLLTAISFYFVKSHFIYFTVILTGTWLMYDWQFLWDNRKQLLKEKTLWLAIAGIIVLLGMRFVYFANIGSASSFERADPSFLFRLQSSSIITFLEYALNLIEYMIAETPYFLGLWWLTIFSIFFVKKINKKYLFTFFATIFIFLLPVASYVVRQQTLRTDSLLRYSGIVMYLFPLAISFVTINRNKLTKLAAAILYSIITIYVFTNLMWPMPLTESFTLSDGRYQTVLEKYYQYATQVLEITGEDENVLIADDLEDQTVTNMLHPAIYIRYYLMNNSVGAQYQGLPTDMLLEYASENNADFVLLLSYADSLEGCEPLLEPDYDYLIDLRSEATDLATDKCVFAPFQIVDLGKAVK
jgi:hypothetical protein